MKLINKSFQKVYKTIIYQSKVINYKIFYAYKYKRLTLKGDENYELIVLSPYGINETQIETFVSNNINKIWDKIEIRKNLSLINLSKNRLMILGHEYIIVRQDTNKKQSKIWLNQLNSKYIHFCVGTSIQNNLNLQKKYLIQQFKKFSTKYLTVRIYDFCKKFNLSIPVVKIKVMKNRWGWCSTKKEIALNIMLIAFEKSIIDHVICHELAHLTHMNHSKAFYDLLAKYDSNYKQAIKKLKFKLD